MIEVLILYAAFALTLIPIFRIQGAVHGYSEAKEYVFVILSAAAFAAMLFTGIPILTRQIDWLFLAFVLYITLSVYWSDAPSLSVKDVPRWWGIFLLYLTCSHVPHGILIPAIFLPAPIIAAYGLYQQIMRRDPLDFWIAGLFKEKQKALRFYSFLGNSNYSGSYLVGSIFAGVWCIANISLWFALPLALVIVGIAYTRCRAAWLGVVVGFFGVLPEMWPFLILGVTVLVILAWGRWEPIKTRIHFLNVGWAMFKERFLFGWGPTCFRRKIFKTQAYMNQQNPRLLGNLKKKPLVETPLGSRMHNDHAEMFVEYGLIGGVLWLAILGFGIYQAVGSGYHFIAGGLLGIAVNALFFYPIRVVGIGIAFWAFLGAAVSPESHEVAFFLPPLYLSIPFLAVLCMLVWRFSIVPLMAVMEMFQFNLARNNGDLKKAERHLRAATDLEPMNGNTLSEFAAFYVQTSPGLALSTAMKCIDLYDGQKIEWSLWVQLGNTAVINGAVEFARACFRMAIYLNPGYERPYKCLEELEKLVNRVQGERPPANVPDGFKMQDGVLVPDHGIEVVKA